MVDSQIISFGNFIYNEQDISPNQLGVTSRQINYWIDNKVTPFIQKQQSIDEGDNKGNKKRTKWIRLNLVQAVWVCIVKELFSLGISIGDLAELAEDIWNKPRKDKYADKVIKDYIKNNKDLSKEAKEILRGYLEDELLMEHYLRTVINPFTDLVKSAILREKLPHSLIYVPSTNEHEFLMHDSELMLKLGSTYLENTLINIPIIPILSKVLAIDIGNQKKDIFYLSEIEKQIRDIVVFKKPKSVEIAFDENHIKPIIVTDQHKTKEELARYILENKIKKGSKLLIDIRSQGNYKITLISK